MWERVDPEQNLEIITVNSTGEIVQINLPQLGIFIPYPETRYWRNAVEAIYLIHDEGLYKEIYTEEDRWTTKTRLKLTREGTMLLLDAMDSDDEAMTYEEVEFVPPLPLPIPW